MSPVDRLARFARGTVGRVLIVLGALLLLGFAVSRVNFKRDLRRVHARVLSGTPEGHYHALVAELGARAAKQKGRLENLPSEGSADNVARLSAAAKSCDVHFALAQIGSEWPKDTKLQLVGRLPRQESLFLLGRKADAITEFEHLRGLRLGIGPQKSGTAQLIRKIVADPDFAALDLKLSHHPAAEQLTLAERGELDLAAFVMDEDAPFIRQAVKERGLQVVGFPHLDVVARRVRWLRHGRIGAGQYDAVRKLPATDKRVLRIETLVLGNGCAGRSEMVGFMTVLSEELPDFVRHNRQTANQSGLDLAPAARNFFDKEGPEWVDEFLPWAVDIMPPTNWVTLVMALSILFNAMGMGHRFRLWRIDVARVRLENELMLLFGPTVTLGDIEHEACPPAAQAGRVRDEMARIIGALEGLAQRCRKESLSFLVPMGQEMAYRYQEDLVHRTLAVLRAYRRRCEAGA